MPDEAYKILIVLISIFSIPTGIYYFLQLKDRWTSPEKGIIPKLPEAIKLGFRVSIFIFFLEIVVAVGEFSIRKIMQLQLSSWQIVLAFNVCILLGIPIGFWIITILFRKYFQ